MNTYDPTETRLQLFRNGYVPIPNINKVTWFTGYNDLELGANLSEEVIRGWRKSEHKSKATGIQVWNGLAALDFDITDQEMMDLMVDAVEHIVGPEVMAKMPWRTGKPPKLMMFARWTELNTQEQFRVLSGVQRSKEYVDAAGAKQKIEIFGAALSHTGRAPKQVGVYGPHEHETNEKGFPILKPSAVLRSYTWSEGPTLLDIRLEDLPPVTPKQVWDLLAAFENAAAARGWTVEEDKTAASNKNRIYDITPETLFEVRGHEEPLTYYDLDEGMIVSASFIDGAAHRRHDRCKALLHPILHILGIKDWHTDVWHFLKSDEPDTEAAARQLADLLKGLPGATLSEDMPPEPKAMSAEERHATGVNRPVEERAGWLLRTHAFEEGNIVNVYRSGKGLSEKAARSRFINWSVAQEGPEGGKAPPLMAFNIWLPHEARLNVAGIQMRPDKPYPVFQENGQLWRNRYRPPAHHKIEVTPEQIAEAAGHFMRLVRNIAVGPGEAEYVLQYAAYKMRNPAEPGCCPFFVNPVFGSGRDLFYEIFAALLGEWNCTKQNVRRLIGEGGRASFNAFLADKVMVYVGEVLDPELRRSSFDQLKEMIDPRNGVISINRKNVEEQDSKRFASIVLATNHVDAIRIEEGDRRFSVLGGGPQLDEAFGVFMETWRKDPINIAALWRHLMTIDLAGYLPYAPLHTDAKTIMVELTKDPVRAALQLIAERADREWKAFSLNDLDVELEEALECTTRERKGLEGRTKQARAGIVIPLLIEGKQLVMKYQGKATRMFCFERDKKHPELVTLDLVQTVTRCVGTDKEKSKDEQVSTALQKVRSLDEARAVKKAKKPKL